MKKIISLLLIVGMLAAALASCANSDPNNTTGSSGTTASTETTESTGSSESTTETTESTTTGKPEEVKNTDYSVEDLMNKVIESIGGKVTTVDDYDGSEFEIMVTGPTHFSVSNANEGKYYSGISESASLVEDDAVWNENAMMGGAPFSMVIVKLKDAKDGDTVKNEVFNGVNMRKWVCRNADYLITVNNGNYVLMVMCSKDTCEKIADAFDAVLEEESGTRLEKEFEMGGGMVIG